MPKRKAQAPPSGDNGGEPKARVQPTLAVEGRTRPVVLFSHGAGAGCSSPWMQKWKKLLLTATDAEEIRCLDYPYMQKGNGSPPKAEKLVDFHAKEMEMLREMYPGRPVILAGKSMGSRVSCMVAGKEDTPVAAVVCLGYPLQGMNRTVRDKPLIEMKAPVIFVQGSKDAMCPLKSLEEVRKKMTVESAVHEVEGGDHSLTCGVKIMKAKGTSQDAVDQAAAEAIKSFIESTIKPHV